MSRYDNPNGGSTGGSGDYEDDITLKLQKYAAVRLTPTGTNASSHQSYGVSFISNFADAEILDGIVFQREDKPQTWKLFSAGKFFNLNPEDGLVYENFDEEDGYSGEMSAQDILDHPRVAGFSESFGGTDYFYKPVGAVIEEASDIATNDDLEVETTGEPTIVIGDASMLLSNKTWTRTFAKKITEQGENIINDNGDDPTPRGEEDTNPKYDDFDWLSTEDPDLLSVLEGRTLEMWLTEETQEWEDGDETTYTTPNLMDTKTGNFVTINNGIQSPDDDSEESSDKAAATDGGTATQDTTDSSDTESPDEPSVDDDDGLPDGVPSKLDDLLDYLARNGESTADEVRDFAESEVENPDDIDWEAAAEEANRRAE